MEFNRTELMPGVFLSHLRSDKFKTACMSVTLLTQLRRETAAMNAIIPYVLRRGTTRYSDMAQLSRRMAERYDAAVDPGVRRRGELQGIGFDGCVVMEPFVKEGGQVGADIKVWRDLSDNADEKKLDEDIKGALQFVKSVF